MGGAAMSFEVLVLLVVLALAFDFMNGFHDSANSIATVVSTRVLRPQWAVAWAAFFNVAAYFIFELKVAGTIGKGTIDPAIVDHTIVFGALVGAISWNVLTWWYGIPSSSSHALIGGLVGAALAKSGVDALVASGLAKTLAFILVSPALGFLFGTLLMIAVSWLFRRTTPQRVDRWFRRLQLASAAMYSLGHGGNDAQKTIGIIWMLLIVAGIATPDHVPAWVIIACYATIGLGTLFGGSCSPFPNDAFTVERPSEPVNITVLMEACAILKCRPEQLFFNADMDGGSGCSTCGDSAYPILTLEVRR